MPAGLTLMHVAFSAVWLQSSDYGSPENTRLLMIFIGILAVSIAVIAIVVVIFAIVTSVAVKKMLVMVEEVKGRSLGIMQTSQGIAAKTQELLMDLTPKIKAVSSDLQPKIKKISGDLTDISDKARSNVSRLEATLQSANETVREANDKAKAQVDRVDGMVSSALSATSRVAETMHHSIRIPVMQVAGVVSGLKAGLDVLLSGAQGKSSASQSGSFGSGTFAPVSPEARREEEMDRIASRYTGQEATAAVPTVLGDDILPGTSVDPAGEGDANRTLAADVIAGQRRAAELRGAPDASDLAVPPLPKRFR